MCSAQPHKENPRHALDAGNRLAGAGDYEAALEQFIWFHEHALEIRRSLYGVRLSYALAYWIELGAKYPRALQTLKGIRDAKTSRLIAGEQSRDLFHDVESINAHLDEHSETVALFMRLDSMSPGFAAQVYDLADEALVRQSEFALARRYLGDAQQRLANARSELEDGLRYAEETQHRESSRRAFETIFSDEVVRIISILRWTGDLTGAKQIQAEALSALPSEHIRDALR